MQGPTELSSHQLDGTLLNCLKFAAQGYEEIARKQLTYASEARDQGEINLAEVHERLAEQFDRQEDEAKELYRLFEEADRVILRPAEEN